MKKELICVVCPIGCSMTAEIENGKVINVSGNTCPRGKLYAETECIAPKRMVTSTVRCKTGEILPVKTNVPIPKENIFDLINIIDKTSPVLPISAGDVIIKDIFGCNIIALKDIL